MTEHPVSKFVWIGIVTAMIVAILFCPNYISATGKKSKVLVSQDIYIRGDRINTFAQGDESVSTVVGNFHLVIGRREISGNEAVIWISQPPAAPQIRHDLTIYVRGDVRILDSGGGVTTEDVLLVTIQHSGQLVAKGEVSTESLSQSPLYQRALEARRTEAPDTINPVVAPEPVQGETTIESAPVPGEAKPEETAQPASINFHFDSFSSTVRGSRRYTIAHGNVYLSRGAVDSQEFIELTGQTAVLISEKRPVRQVNVPWALKTAGVATDLPGPKGVPETLTGIYLEGDVVIRRGEQMMRSPAAYYDLGSDRALIIDPVFRTVQPRRDIPIYIRADEARVLSIRQWWFKKARFTTSDFFSPSYHIAASEAYVMDTTPYDELGVRLGEQSIRASYKHATFNINSIPILYSPYGKTDFEQGHTALRNITVGRQGNDFGMGIETDWHLFRMLGLIKPEGFSGRVEMDLYERGFMKGVTLDYERPTFSGYSRGFYVSDQEHKDDFGNNRKDIDAPEDRARILIRHKQFMPKDWQLQLELSYICDRNFLEQFFPSEFFAGKDQETLAYARKQKDNWAFTSLLKYRLNRFDTQIESLPEFGLFLVGEPIAADQLTFFSETNIGLLRARFDNALKVSDSDYFPVVHSRHEIDWPVKLGPINVTPYATGRLNYFFEDKNFDGSNCRQYGQLGIRVNTHIWRIDNSVQSRIWDLNKIKHIVTPEVIGFIADEVISKEKGMVGPRDGGELNMYTQDKDQLSGVAVGIHQRWQTKRGPLGAEEIVDWLRWDVDAAWFFNKNDKFVNQKTGKFSPSDGRFFFSRPENSIPRDHIRTEVIMALSDSTSFMADANYDLHTDSVRRVNAGLSVVRDPRFRYYLGARYIKQGDSLATTLGLKYKISRKYTLDLFEQYDMKFDGGQNSATSATLTRKMERWYASFSLSYSAADEEISFFVTIWPQGIPEVRIGSGRLNLLGLSEKN